MQKRKGFTLIELLVVIAIIAVLLGLLIAGIHKATAAAERVECASKMRQLGLAVHAYHDLNGHFPLQAGGNENSWMFKILPYVEQEALYQQGAGHGVLYQETFGQIVPAFRCPADLSQPFGSTTYLGVAGRDSAAFTIDIFGWDGIFGSSNITVRMGQLTRGLSNTLMAGERPRSGWAGDLWGSVLWTIGNRNWIPCGTNYTLCPPKMYFSEGNLNGNSELDCHLAHYWSFHTGGGNWLFADATVQFMSYDAGETIIPDMASTTAYPIE